MFFVDIDGGHDQAPAEVAARLRAAPPAITASATRLVVRAPLGSTEDWQAVLGEQLAAVLQRIQSDAQVSIVDLALGGVPNLLRVDPGGTVSTAEVDASLLGTARRVEIEAILRNNNGIWKPADYHFRLPSGAHGNCFVRVADAIRTPRDAFALMSWLLPLVHENTGLLIDSSSLVALATALDGLVTRSGASLGPIVSLEEYPKNRLDTMKAVRDVDRGSNVVALLSVHSTGSLMDRVLSALDQVASSQWVLQVLVDKAGDPGGDDFVIPAADASPLDRTVVWARLGESRDMPPEDCVNCRNGPARVAQIDPRTFDGMVLPTPDLLMPSAHWAFGQRDFWHLVDGADAVTVEAPSDVSGLHPRYGTDKFMSVKVNFGDLLAHDPNGLAAACRDRLTKLIDEEKVQCPSDLIVLDPREAELEQFGKLLGEVASALGDPAIVTLGSEPDIPDGDRDRICESRHILLFRLGLVSGLSLQQAMYRIQQFRRGTDPYVLDGLVVHLRPQDGRVRETIRNSLARRLSYLWESYIPEDRHPLQEEADVISSIHGDLPDHVQAFLDERLALGTGFPSDGQILWGAGAHVGDEPSRLSPMSYFGEDLRVRSAYAAIGSAVHHARIKADAPRGAPLWRMFEIPAILRSYYDPIIVCCVLRWLRSTEVWWGDNLREGVPLLQGLIRRADTEAERVMLMSELLLAAAQAKVPSELHDTLFIDARMLADGVGAPMNAPILLGLLAAGK